MCIVPTYEKFDLWVTFGDTLYTFYDRELNIQCCYFSKLLQAKINNII